MKILLAGAFGHLGSAILRALCETEHEILAAGRTPRPIGGVDVARYTAVQIDVTDPEALEGLCEGVDAVISTVGLTKASATLSPYDIDYRGNLNLLNEAKRAGVRHFAYVSVIRADEGRGAPMVQAKFLMEQALRGSGLDYVIYRPTGYFYDIAKIFESMVQKGEAQLLRVSPEPSCNVLAMDDFALFIRDTFLEKDKLYSVGGRETYTYREIAEMFFRAYGVKGRVKTVPPFVMSLLAALPKMRKTGRRDVILFSKFILTRDCVGDTVVGERSFRAYIESRCDAD